MSRNNAAVVIGADEALRLAHADARTVYRDLSPYRNRLALETDGWHVGQELGKPGVEGRRSALRDRSCNGAIVSKCYEQ